MNLNVLLSEFKNKSIDELQQILVETQGSIRELKRKEKTIYALLDEKYNIGVKIHAYKILEKSLKHEAEQFLLAL